MKLFSFSKLFANHSSEAQAAGGGAPRCPQCSYILDRPHAARCSRCQAEIPLAMGCSGCGRCKNV